MSPGRVRAPSSPIQLFNASNQPPVSSSSNPSMKSSPSLRDRAAPPLPPVQCYAEAIYDSPPENQPGDLVFHYGDTIEVLWKDDAAEWWRGRLNGVIGVFPKSYVMIRESLK